jgi:GH43 family beta-xylosidase
MMTTFQNPIMDNGPDPYMVKHTDGFYYYVATTGRNITVWKSKTMSGMKHGQSKAIWTAPAAGPCSRDTWAPEIHHIDDKWYVYFAASDGNFVNRRMYVLENASKDLFADTWVEKGKIAAPTDRWAIDGTVLNNGGEYYFIWSGWEGETRVAQHIYIARMSNPWTIGSERAELSRPTFDWEKVRMAGKDMPYINEGPAVLKRNGNLFIAYSASVFTSDDYCLGLLTADERSDLMDPASWVKASRPVFQKSIENHVFGPGHNSFVTSPDGSEDWIVYHAFSVPSSQTGRVRSARMQKFTWKADGTPDFGIPLPIDAEIDVPSGEEE